MKKVINYIFCLFLLASFLYAEETPIKEKLEIKIEQIISSDFPNLKIYSNVKNNEGELITNLSPSLFSFRIDSAEFKVKSKITPVSLLEESVNYVILLSNNGIMEGEPLDFQKNAILKFSELMNDNDTLSVFTIGEEAGLVCENVTKKKIDSAIINDIKISSAQPRLFDSLMNLVRKVDTNDSRRKVIIVLSDGRDQNSRFSKEQLIDTLVDAGIPIYSVGMKILSNQTLSILDEISQITGGTYFYSSKLSSIPNNIKNVIDCCQKGFVIELKVKGLKADNFAHLLELTVDERDSQGKGEKTFIATKLPVPKWLKILVLVIVLIVILLLIFFILFSKVQRRKSMGITKRKCKDCGSIMKDNWDYCPFCKYLPEIKKKGKKRNNINAK